MLWSVFAFLFVPAIALVVLVVFGVLAWRTRRAGYLLPIVAVLACEGVALCGSHNEQHYWDGWELNVSFLDVTASDLAGTWRRGDEVMTLAADGTFRARSGASGTWSMGPLGPASIVVGGEDFRLLRHDGRIVLLPDRPDRQDPDEWNKWSCWEKAE